MATIHAGLGTIAELLGLYIVLVAATSIVPKRLSFKRWKPWMRTELALWWLVIVLGIGTYYVWYVAPASNRAPQSAAATMQSQKTLVRITNFQFQPKELSIAAGATVEWIDETGRHSVEADDGSFKSEVLTAGGRFEYRFDRPGVYSYYCGFHGDKGGKNMAGVIRVESPSR